MNQQLLKQKIESVYGRNVRYYKDCIALSESIYNKLGERISPLTLARFLLNSNTSIKPRKYTLDTLLSYANQQFAQLTDRASEPNTDEKFDKFIDELIEKYNENFLCALYDIEDTKHPRSIFKSLIFNAFKNLEQVNSDDQIKSSSAKNNMDELVVQNAINNALNGKKSKLKTTINRGNGEEDVILLFFPIPENLGKKGIYIITQSISTVEQVKLNTIRNGLMNTFANSNSSSIKDN